MAKYLRYLDTRFADADGRDEPTSIDTFSSAKSVWHLTWMYAHYALPLPTNGVAKVNVFFTADDIQQPPEEVLGIADVWERFDPATFLSLTDDDQPRYFLERLHAALLHCAAHYGWDSTRLQAAHDRIVAENFKFSFYWKKPLTSPDRKHKVQADVDAVHPSPMHLVFFDPKSNEIRRSLLSLRVNGLGVVEFLLDNLKWIDAETVKVSHKNKRDYWLCRLNGDVEFHYPRGKPATRTANTIWAACTTTANSCCKTRNEV